MVIAERKPNAGIESPLISTNPFTVQGPVEFIQSFRSVGNESRNRLFAKVMVVQQGHFPSLILETLHKNAHKGINVQLILDKNSDIVSGKDKLTAELTRRRIEDLAASGVKIHYKDHKDDFRQKLPKIGKYFGRHHGKIYIADDTAWIGGLNLENSNFQNIDFMVKITKKEIVDALASFFEKDYNPLTDYTLKPDDENEILFDVGNRGESIILDKGVDLIRNATESVQITSMLIPDGPILEALLDAIDRGVEVSVLTSDHKLHKAGLSRMVQEVAKVMYNKKFEKKLPLTQRKNQFVHAKLLIVDGKKTMFGSHNLSSKGVALGTEEIAMITTNPGLVGQLEDFFQKELEKIAKRPQLLEL